MGRLSNEEKQRRASEATVEVSPAIREPIKQMTGFPTEAAMADALPDNTMTPPEGEAPKRKRRTKAEIEASRAQVEPEVDPLMADPRYRKAVEKMRSAGLSTTVKGGFEAVALGTQDDEWRLKPEEITDVEDFSYVVSKKYAIFDPTRHWISMAIYFFGMLGTLVFKRAAKAQAGAWIKQVTEWFTGGEEKDAQQIEDEKKASV